MNDASDLFAIHVTQTHHSLNSCFVRKCRGSCLLYPPQTNIVLIVRESFPPLSLLTSQHTQPAHNVPPPLDAYVHTLNHVNHNSGPTYKEKYTG